jgi:serine/threonine protein phosphatase PrpC
MQAGGYVLMGRVCGNLAVSRALGDYDYKDRPDLPQDMQKVGAGADVTIIDRVPLDDYLVLACDGIWDVISNEQAVEFITRYVVGPLPLPLPPLPPAEKTVAGFALTQYVALALSLEAIFGSRYATPNNH